MESLVAGIFQCPQCRKIIKEKGKESVADKEKIEKGEFNDGEYTLGGKVITITNSKLKKKTSYILDSVCIGIICIGIICIVGFFVNISPSPSRYCSLSEKLASGRDCLQYHQEEILRDQGIGIIAGIVGVVLIIICSIIYIATGNWKKTEPVPR